MRLMTETTARRRVGVLTRIPTWIGRRQRELSDRVHAAGDECARQHGWEVTKSTGRFGFGARTYRDPRFDGRCPQLSHGAAQVTGRDRSGASLEVNRPACGPDAAAYISPEKEAVLAEWLDDPRAETGPTEDQIIGWNEANDYWNHADEYEADREAGE